MEFDIKDRVHECYWVQDINCAKTMLICLCERFDIHLEKQTFDSAAGLHGAGGFRAQCGLVEGALMFLGLFLADRGKIDHRIADICYRYAEEFTQRFGSLRCFTLRPNGFNENDPPHVCENLTVEAVKFAIKFAEQIKIDNNLSIFIDKTEKS